MAQPAALAAARYAGPRSDLGLLDRASHRESAAVVAAHRRFLRRRTQAASQTAAPRQFRRLPPHRRDLDALLAAAPLGLGHAVGARLPSEPARLRGGRGRVLVAGDHPVAQLVLVELLAVLGVAATSQPRVPKPGPNTGLAWLVRQRPATRWPCWPCWSGGCPRCAASR